MPDSVPKSTATSASLAPRRVAAACCGRDPSHARASLTGEPIPRRHHTARHGSAARGAAGRAASAANGTPSVAEEQLGHQAAAGVHQGCPAAQRHTRYRVWRQLGRGSPAGRGLKRRWRVHRRLLAVLQQELGSVPRHCSRDGRGRLLCTIWSCLPGCLLSATTKGHFDAFANPTNSVGTLAREEGFLAPPSLPAHRFPIRVSCLLAVQDSAYYFGGDSNLHRGLNFESPLSGLPYFDRSSDGYERISAYRFHARDPLVMVDGGSLVWRVGAQPSGPGQTKCGNLQPPSFPGPIPPSPPGPPSGPTPPPTPPPSPPGPPAVVGCADGTCEALCDVAGVRGCAAEWDTATSMRSPKSAGAAGCGGGLGKCKVPADACAPGWEVCLSNVTGALGPADLRKRLSGGKCSGGHPGRFVAGMSHAQPKWEHLKTQACPPGPQDGDNGCLRAVGHSSR